MEKLQISEQNVELYTTEYVNVEMYKTLRIITNFSHSAYMYVYHSLDGKTDSLTSTFLIQGGKGSLHKIEVATNYIRVCIASQRANELIDNVIVNVKGRRAVSSGMFNLIEKFSQQSNEPRELNLEKEEKQERTSGIYKRLGIHSKPKEKKEHICRCDLLPQILLPGQILYCKDRGLLNTVPPPPVTGENYFLMQQNRTVYWASTSEAEKKWFNP